MKRKIFSILLALVLVLSFSLVAVPVFAQQGNEIPVTDSEARADQPDVAIDSQGNVHIAYTDGADVYYQTFGTSPNRYTVIQWGTSHYGGDGPAKFQAILYEDEDGDIDVNIADSTGVDGSITGVNKGDGSNGVDIGVTPPSNTSYRFTWDGSSDYNDSTITYNWIDASGGNPVGAAQDDSSGPVPIGFDFTFYGTTYTTVYVSSNGYMSFTVTDPTATTGPSSFPSSSSSAANVIAPLWDDWKNPREIWYTMLDNSGNTLIDDTRLTDGDGYDSTRPAIVIDSDDKVHIVWRDQRWDSGGSQELTYTKLDPSLVPQLGDPADEPTITVVDDTRLTDLGDWYLLNFRMAIDSNNHIHIVGENYDDDYIYYMKIDDNGDELVALTVIRSGYMWRASPDVAVDSNNDVHIAWNDSVYTDDYETYYMMLDGSDGSTLIDATLITPDDWDSSKGQSIVVDDEDKVHIIWKDQRGDGQAVYYTKLDPSLYPGDITLIPGKAISQDSSGYWVKRVASAIQDGYIHISWWEDYEDDEHGYLYYMVLDTDGNVVIEKTVTADETVTTSTEWTVPYLDVDANGKAHIVWCDDRTGNYEVWYATPKMVENQNTGLYYLTIQAAIDVASASDIISVPAGKYTEDLIIPAGKDNLELAGATGATIKGMALSEWGISTLPNIDILADGASIHGFTIQGPEPSGTLFAGGMIIGAQDVEIYLNAFEVNNASDTENYDDISQGIVAYNKRAIEGVDVSGLDIHDNTFTDRGAGTLGYEGIYINRDEGTGPITIEDNVLTGDILRGITVERSNATISGNSLVTDISGWSGILVMDLGGYYDVGAEDQDNIDIIGNTVEGFDPGIKVGPSDQSQVLTNISITQNTLQGNGTGVLVRSSADGVVINYNDISGNTAGVQNTDTGVELDATNNWWGEVSGPTHEDNTYYAWDDQGDAVSADVDYCPWLDAHYATGVSFAPVTSDDPEEQNFSSIQAAIDAATSTTITAKAGWYDESLYIDKSLTVQSEDGAVTGGGEWEPVTMLFGEVVIELGWDGENPLAETVVFDGFYIEEQEMPIYLYEVDNGSSLTISNNVLDWYYVGILSGGFTVDNGSSVIIEGNYLFGSQQEETCGIYFDAVVGGSELTIRDNKVFWNEVGIYIDYLEGASTVTIEDNIVAENEYGIELYDAEESTVTIAGNTIGEWYDEEWGDFSGNYYGIYLGGNDSVYGSTITIGGDTRAEGNIIVGNGGEGGGGIYVDYMVASSLKILNNDILDNESGVEIWSFDEASTVDIHYNSIAGNYDGVNNGSRNTINATGNWWGDVAGPDILTNPYDFWTIGDSVSSAVDYIPWLIQNELAGDWNIWSRPIAPDEDSWEQMQAELVEDGIEAIYYYDNANQIWGIDPDDAGALDAFYIKMPAESRIRYCFSDEATFPGEKEMTIGWNFVGLAELYELNADDALDDAFWGAGQTEPIGYNKIMSPSLNGTLWTYMREVGEPPYMYPTMGYWVLMVNDGTLGGFTTTPIVEVEELP